MRRFFLGHSSPAGELLSVTGADAHHLKNVLRLKPGAKVIFFDGQGREFEVELLSLQNREVTARILACREEPADRCRVALGQGILTGPKMDLVVQKATELGLAAIIPFTSSFCTAKNPAGTRSERWQRIAREACKQCGRAREPEILPVTPWSACLAAARAYEQKVLFWEKEKNRNLDDLRGTLQASRPTTLLFLVGPEGGLAEAEAEQARQHDFQVFGLGRRILRAETASFTAAALVQYLVGNLE
jgi:16S rRNA (uracil1498-N3)-methyltransferase